MIHYPTLKKEVLVALRGKLSRSQCSQKMGFTFNKVQRWESGTAEIDWLEFIELTRICRKDLTDSFKKHLGFGEDSKNYSALLNKMIQESEVVNVAKKMGIPKSSLKAWMKGQRAPKLVHMLQILNDYQRLLPEILEEVVSIEKIPSLKNEILTQKKMREFAYQYPFTPGMLCLIEIYHRRSEPVHEGIFSKILGIPLSQENSWLKKAHELGLIEIQDQKIKLVSKMNVDTQGDFVPHHKIKEFWTLKTLDRMNELTAPDPHDRFGYMVFSGSIELMQKIQKEYYSFFQKIKTLVTSHESQAPDALAILNTQFIIKQVKTK